MKQFDAKKQTIKTSFEPSCRHKFNVNKHFDDSGSLAGIYIKTGKNAQCMANHWEVISKLVTLCLPHYELTEILQVLTVEKCPIDDTPCFNLVVKSVEDCQEEK